MKKSVLIALGALVVALAGYRAGTLVGRTAYSESLDQLQWRIAADRLSTLYSLERFHELGCEQQFEKYLRMMKREQKNILTELAGAVSEAEQARLLGDLDPDARRELANHEVDWGSVTTIDKCVGQ